jgi:hypothetical protein
MYRMLAKSLDVLLRRPREEKQLVKVAVLDCVGFVSRKTGVLDQLARRQGAKRHHSDASLL